MSISYSWRTRQLCVCVFYAVVAIAIACFCLLVSILLAHYDYSIPCIAHHYTSIAFGWLQNANTHTIMESHQRCVLFFLLLALDARLSLQT